MAITYTEEQRELVQLVRDVARNEVMPHVAAADKAGECPRELYQWGFDLGLHMVEIPEQFGGMGLTYETCAMMFEELAWVDAAYADTFVTNFVAFRNILLNGTEEQARHFVEKTENNGFAAFCLTEANAGSDVAAMRTTAVLDGDEYVLNGTKTFITSSAGVKYLVIMAKNADDESQFTEFFVDMSKPGVKLSPLPKLGLRMDSCCEVYLDNVELEESDIFGKEGNGFMRGVSDFNFERWLVGACDYGTAICSFEDAMKHANTRIAFGKPISRFQLNSLKITEMCIKLTNMRNMLYEAAWMDNNGGDFDPAMAAMCKYYCANASFEVTDDAMQVMGGIAVASEHRINRIWRDLRVDRVSGGTDEMMILATSKGACKAYKA